MLSANLVGNVGGDPDLRYAQSGTAVLRFNVASNGRTRTQDGQWQDKTEWIQVVVFGERAERLSEHLHKGMKVYVGGKLEARPWTDRDNQVRAGLELTAGEIEFVSARQEGSGTRQQAPEQRGRPAQPQQRGQGGQRMNEWQAAHAGEPADVPF